MEPPIWCKTEWYDVLKFKVSIQDKRHIPLSTSFKEFRELLTIAILDILWTDKDCFFYHVSGKVCE